MKEGCHYFLFYDDADNINFDFAGITQSNRQASAWSSLQAGAGTLEVNCNVIYFKAFNKWS